MLIFLLAMVFLGFCDTASGHGPPYIYFLVAMHHSLSFLMQVRVKFKCKVYQQSNSKVVISIIGFRNPIISLTVFTISFFPVIYQHIVMLSLFPPISLYFRHRIFLVGQPALLSKLPRLSTTQYTDI